MKRGNKTVGFFLKDGKSFVIGFRKLIHARNVQYNIHPEPNFYLVKSKNVTRKDGISVHFASTLVVPKGRHGGGGAMHPLNDAGLHMQPLKPAEFYGMPYKGVGVVLPYELLDEDRHEFTFMAHVVQAHMDHMAHMTHVVHSRPM